MTLKRILNLVLLSTLLFVSLKAASNEGYKALGNISDDLKSIDGTKGNSYFCDPKNGSMDNSGTEDSPWASLAKVMKAGKEFADGDIIYLMTGDHGFPEITEINTDYVTITAADGQKPVCAGIKLNKCEFWEINGIEINADDTELPSAPPLEHPVYPLFENTLVQISKCSDIIIKNCFVASINNATRWSLDDWNEFAWNGIISSGSKNVTISGNFVKNINFGIQTDGGSNVIFEGNIVENFCGDGLRPNTDYTVVENNIVRNCYNTNGNHDDLLQVYTGNDVKGVVIRGNQFYNSTDPYQNLSGSAQGIACFDGMLIDFVIENNIVVTNHYHGITLLGATNCKIINNIAIDPNNTSPGPAWIQVAPHKDKRESTGNIVKNNICTQLKLSTGIGEVDNNIQINYNDYNTYFVNAAENNFHPKEGNPAIDAGLTIDDISNDLDGNDRPYGSAFDIGAYEFQGQEFLNNAPVLGELNDIQTEPAKAVSFVVSAEDSDGDLVIFDISGNPSFVKINDNRDGTAEITIIPGFNIDGDYKDIYIIASDGYTSDKKAFQVSVHKDLPNTAPELSELSDQTIFSDEESAIDISATDAEDNDLSFTVENLPDFAQFTDNGDGTAKIVLNPTTDDIGVYDGIKVNVTDGTEAVDGTFQITVEKFVGIESTGEETKVMIYPNPSATGAVQVRVPENLKNKNYSLELYSLSGKLLFSKNIINQELHKIQLPVEMQGVFLLKFISESKTESYKVIIK